MKKTLCAIFIALAVLTVAVTAYTTVDNRTLKNTLSHFTEIDVFVPSGMANEYEDLVPMTFDDHRIWKYKLNKKEAAEMTEELKNSCWLEFSDAERTKADFYIPDEKWRESFSEETYYCLFDTFNDEFVSFGSWVMPRFLFVYDAVNQEYCCVSVTI